MKKYVETATEDSITSSELNTLINSVYNAIIGIDDDEHIRIFNLAAEKIFGMRSEDILGKPYQDIFPKGPLAEILESGKIQASQKVYYQDKILVSNRSPVVEDGKILGAVAVLQDISELEKVSNELKYTKELNNELDAILNESFDYMFLTDAKGKVLRVNKAYTRITGIQADDVLGKSMYDLLDQNFFDKAATVEVIKKNKRVTFTQKIKTGKTVLVTGNPIFNENGELIRVLTNGRDITELNKLKQEVEQAQELSRHYQEELKRIKMQSEGDYIAVSQQMKDIFHLIDRMGRVDSTILIQGESGVGKEIIAQEIHKYSYRKDKPYIKINCAAIPDNLLESELFGYEAGAFTGAQRNGKLGLFELANKGTLFLDEIGELPLSLQVKLLRVIQEGEIRRLGGSKAVEVDVRLITATNRNLWEMVSKKQFREDLFYRLNVIPIYVPPLRERKEDIPALINHFTNIFNNKYAMSKRLDEGLTRKMLSYEWPGNVRELRNVIERALVSSPEQLINEIKLSNYESVSSDEAPPISFKDKVESYEKELLSKYIRQYGSSRKAARALGVSQTTIVRKAGRYNISLQER